MLPPMLCVATMNKAELLEQISTELALAGFKYIFFITSDHSWTQVDEEYNTIWLPSIPLESMDGKMRQSVLGDQLRQIIPVLSAKWN